MRAQAARARVRRFRQGTMLAIVITAILLMLWGTPDVAGQEAEPAPAAPADADRQAVDPGEALEEAATTVQDLFSGMIALLPKLAIAMLLLLFAYVLARLFRIFAQRALHGWERVEAMTALVRVALFLLATGAALSVIAGDARTLVGSVGLTGLALSWALQTPIESFSGWVVNAFRGYYRTGDRIEVGDVFGDVYRIDILTTTVWEAGGAGKSVAGAQPTGAMITFPNWEILRSNIINYSREFPYVWDEVTIGVANESDLAYTIRVFRDIAREITGEKMRAPAFEYKQLLERARLAFDIDPDPQVYLTLAESWTNCTVRYLVAVRERRRRSTELLLALSQAIASPEHAGRIRPALPRTQIEMTRQ